MEPKPQKRWLIWTLLLVVIALILLLGWQYSDVLFGRVSETSKSNSTATPSAENSTKAELWTASETVIVGGVTSSDTHKISENLYRIYYMADGGFVYSEFDSSLTLGSPKSTGITEDNDDLMISNPSVLKIADDNWIMIYEKQPKRKNASSNNNPPGPETQRNLYLATSTDGKTFTKVGQVYDSSVNDDYFASVPDLILLSNGQIRMYFVSGGQAVGSALSSDNGRTWQRESGYRLEDSAVDPDVMQITSDGQAKWVMYYSKIDPAKNGLYKATSMDGLKWTEEQKIMSNSSSGGVIVDPDVVQLDDGSLVMFFGKSADGQNLDLYLARKN